MGRTKGPRAGVVAAIAVVFSLLMAAQVPDEADATTSSSDAVVEVTP